MPPISDSLPGFETSSFYGVGAPRGTPRPIVDLLNREINAALADPVIRPRAHRPRRASDHRQRQRFAAMLAAETERWRKVVEMSGQKKA